MRRPVIIAISSVVLSLGLAVSALGDLSRPDKHFKLKAPAKLKHAEAEAVYQNLLAVLTVGLSASDYPPAKTYRKWTRFNSAPYLSATHGNRYINNYGNAAAQAYATLQQGTVMPPGAILVKDSFTATSDGRHFPAAFFAMQKLKPGTSPETGDWRYVMILPDGSAFGDSMAKSGGDMGFCHGCHASVADRDYLFHIPRTYRKP